MSGSKHRAPQPVIASAVPWKRTDGTSIPVVRITGGRGTIYVGPDDLSDLARAVVTASKELQAAGDAA